MIRIAIVILVLLVGCAMPPEPEPRFIGQYLSLETFKTDYPLKWTHCPGQNTEKISKIFEIDGCFFNSDRPQPVLHNLDSGEVVADYRNGYS